VIDWRCRWCQHYSSVWWFLSNFLCILSFKISFLLSFFLHQLLYLSFHFCFYFFFSFFFRYYICCPRWVVLVVRFCMFSKVDFLDSGCVLVLLWNVFPFGCGFARICGSAVGVVCDFVFRLRVVDSIFCCCLFLFCSCLFTLFICSCFKCSTVSFLYLSVNKDENIPLLYLYTFSM